MPVFYCKVVDERGKTSEFIRETLSEDILIRELSTDKLYPLVIEETEIASRKIKGKTRFAKKAVIEFTETLTMLMSSGLTLKDALEIAQTIFLRGKLNKLTARLLEKIKKGTSFHDSLESFGGSFPPIYKGMIKVGEKVGSLERAFQGLSFYLKEEQKLREKFIGSMIYPIIVLTVAFAGIVVIVSFVLPRIRGIFLQLGSYLPARIESMMSVVNSLIFIGASVIGLIALSVLFYCVIHKKRGQLAEKLDLLFLKIPLIGKIKRLRESFNFLFAMETLTESGFSVEDALQEAENVVNNMALQSEISKARMKVLKGETLSFAFFDNPIFSDRLSRWMSIGEKSGHVEKAFSQLRRHYQSEIEKWSSHFTNIIEPALILFVGTIILLIILFFVMPIFSLYGNL